MTGTVYAVVGSKHPEGLTTYLVINTFDDRNRHFV